jgi:hypothetical protein
MYTLPGWIRGDGNDEIYYKRNPTGNIITAVGNSNTIVTEFNLYQNYPNPFNPITTIRYQLPVNTKVRLKVYDILGREVTTLVDEVQDAGYKQVQWDASPVASGVYFCRLTTGGFTAVKKLIAIK